MLCLVYRHQCQQQVTSINNHLDLGYQLVNQRWLCLHWCLRWSPQLTRQRIAIEWQCIQEVFQSLTLERVQGRFVSAYVLRFCEGYLCLLISFGLCDYKIPRSLFVQGRADPVKGGTSLFGRFPFGSQLFQKTVELVLKPRQGRQVVLINCLFYEISLQKALQFKW